MAVWLAAILALLFGATLVMKATSAAEPVEVYVFGEEPVSTATERSVRQKDLELRPTATPVDVLTSSVPGLYTVQHQGGGKADEYFLRGFDADHGTDFAIFVDGIPVNLPNNAHGQGYADVHWLIPEIVDHIDVVRRGRVRRAKLYYLRDLRGKAARIKERDFRNKQAKA